MKKDRDIRVLIAAGGTGGHVFPGIAIAEEMRRLHPEVRLCFAGTERGIEAQVLSPLGWPLVLMRSQSIKDRRGIGRWLAFARLPFSVLAGLRILWSERPRLLICVGGYAAGPLAIAAWLSRVPFVIVEPNAIAGFTNRRLGRRAKRVFVAFEEARPSFPPERVIVSGNPVRKEVLSTRRPDAPIAGEITFFVFGGSQGARTLNRAMVAALPSLSEVKGGLRVLHQTGNNDDPGAIARAYQDAGIEAKVFPFTERIWECYREADVVVARAGATTVAELLALGLPSILVPYPYAADDHQRANALGLTRTGGAVLIADADLTGERLAKEIRSFIDRPSRVEAMRAALKKAGRTDAAKVIVEESWKFVR